MQPVAVIRHDGEIRAKALAFDRQQRQWRDEPTAVTHARVTIERTQDYARTHVETFKGFPVQRPPLVSHVLAACAVAVDEGARHYAVIFGDQHFRAHADVVVAVVFAAVEVIGIDAGVHPHLGGVFRAAGVSSGERKWCKWCEYPCPSSIHIENP